MSLPVRHLYEFGEFRLDTQEKFLMRGEEHLELTPKAFELLTFFIENPGRLLKKDEIMEKVWAESFVEDSNLTFNIGQLRKILGDDAQQPIFIKTVRQHGYRFIAPVKEIVEEPPVETIEDFSPRPTEDISRTVSETTNNSFLQHISKPNLAFISLAILLISGLALALILNGNFRSKNVPILNAEFKSNMLTTTGGVALAVISPNGKRMAYVSNVAGKQSLWLRNLETSENVPILPPMEAFYGGLDISHDGETLYFARGTRDSGLTIYQISAIGGIPKEIVKGTQGWLSISPDDRQISFVRCPYTDDDFCSLYIVDTDGKNEQKLLTRPRPIRMADNQFSPDGNSVAVALGQSRSGSQEFGLVEVDIKTKAEKEITKQKFFVIKYLKWFPDKSGLFFTAVEQFATNAKIFQISAETGEVKALTNDSGNYNKISLDKANEKMVATQITSDFRLWTAAANDPKAAKTISFSRGGFAFARSGKIFYSLTTERTQIWSMNTDGSEQRQLTNSQGGNWSPLISPDERFVYFISNRSGSNQVWQMNPDGSNQVQISQGEGGTPWFVSPDGNTVYYGTSINSNLAKVTVDEQGNFVSSIVLNERLYWATGNPTGEMIAYFSPIGADKYEIKLMNAADGKILKTLALEDERLVLTKMSWTGDSKYLFYLTAKDLKNTLWRLSIETGKSEKFADLGDEEVTDFAFSADGKTLGFIRGSWKHDAFLIEGLK